MTTTARLRPAPPRSDPTSRLVPRLLLGSALGLSSSLALGVGLGAWLSGPLGALGGALAGPILGGVALVGWLLIGLCVRLTFPPRVGTGFASTLSLSVGCATVAALLSVPLALLLGLPAEGGAVLGIALGLVAGLALDVALYD